MTSQILTFTELTIKNTLYQISQVPVCVIMFSRPLSLLTSLEPKIPCHDLMCLSCLSVGLPSTQDSTEAGGVTATLTSLLWLSWSNVSLLKKTNAETRGWPRYYVVSNMLLV